MKPSHLVAQLISAIFFGITSLIAQPVALVPGTTINKNIGENEHHIYTIALQKGEYLTATVMQKGVDVAIDIKSPDGKVIGSFDSPNGTQGPEPVAIEALSNGIYQMDIYNFVDSSSAGNSTKLPDTTSKFYIISDVSLLSADANQQRLAQIQEHKDLFIKWLQTNNHVLQTVDAGSGFQDLQLFKNILKNVQVVGLGESSHGTSEFFRMKHRMLEFLVKEMGFNAFYIEASRKRCEYINRYVLYGEGSLDTATTIHGFTTWRVEEVRNMIQWMRQYNTTVSADRQVKFMGYDIQINDVGQKELGRFYQQVAPQKVTYLDSLWAMMDSAASAANNPNSVGGGANLFRSVYAQCQGLLQDLVLNNGSYQYITGKEIYDKNLTNIKLILEEVISYMDGYNDRRDYYMAQNILELLNKEKPGFKVVVWAHNSHISKNGNGDRKFMGNYLAQTLQQKYYALGFEFYEGSFQSRNLDINNQTRNWDIITIGAPPIESLAWYLEKVDKEKYFLDFRNASAKAVKNLSLPYQMHGFGSMYSSRNKMTSAVDLKGFDGLIYIRHSTAAKNFTKVGEGR